MVAITAHRVAAATLFLAPFLGACGAAPGEGAKSAEQVAPASGIPEPKSAPPPVVLQPSARVLPAGAGMRHVEVREGAIIIEDGDGKEWAYSVVEGGEPIDLSTQEDTQESWEEREARHESLAKRLGIAESDDDEFVSELRGDVLAVVDLDGESPAVDDSMPTTRDNVRVRMFRWPDLAPMGEARFLSSWSGGIGHRSVAEVLRVRWSPGGRWLVVNAGGDALTLIELKSMTVKETYRFRRRFAGAEWGGLEERWMLVHEGCYCSGEDGTRETIHDLEADKKLFELEYKHLGLLHHEKLEWNDDAFWLVEDNRIRVWDLVSGALLWTVPLTPSLPRMSPPDFSHSARAGLNRREYEGGEVFHPFVAWMASRDQAVIVRSDHDGFEVTKRARGGAVEKERFPLQGIQWMAFVEGHLVVVTEDGVVYTRTEAELLER